MLRSSFKSVITSHLPAQLVMAIQIAFSCLVSVGVAHLTLFLGHLTPFELSVEYIPLTGAYYAAVSQAEKKWPSWTWLLILLPSQLPTD
jgi:hypothetical protein